MGVLQGAEDLTRIGLHSLGAGIPEFLDRRFGGEAGAAQAARNEQELAAARERTGALGTAVDVGAMLFGAGKVFKGGKAVLRGAHELPRFLDEAGAAVARATRGGRAASTIGRSEARTRLGLEALPGFGARVASLAKVPLTAVKAHPVATAGAVAAGLLGYNADTPSTAAAAPKAAAKPAAKPAAKSTSPAAQAAQAADPFHQMMAEVAAAQGGKISLGQMAAIADMTYKTTPRTTRTPTGKDVAAAHYSDLADQVFSQAQAQAQAMRDAGDQKGAQDLWNSAVRERQKADQIILSGADPSLADYFPEGD